MQSGRRRALAFCLAGVVAVGVAVPVFVSMRHAAAWWSNGWFYRKKITLNNSASSENLVNFPIRVSLSSSNINYSHTQDSGQDIRFVDSDDATLLSHEIEKWDESGTSEVWVRVPQIDAGSTTDFIYMYYGNASVADGQDAAGTWNSDFVGVWHSGEANGASALADSTSNGNDAATHGGIASGAGMIGDAQTYNGTNAYASAPDSNSLDMNDNMTISAWIRATSIGSDWQSIACKATSASPNYCFQTDQANKINFNYTGTFLESPSATSIATNTWYFVTVVYDNAANKVNVYLNGSLDKATNQTTALPPNTATLDIGNDVANEYWPGKIDELRIATNPQSPDWVEAEYITETNAMNTFGAEEQFPPLAPTLTALTISEPLQPVFQLRSVDQVDPTYLRYKIEICSNSDCSSVIRTVDQTASQTGWSGQDAQSGTAYNASATPGASTLATYTYQTPALSQGTQYWWRAYAIDPSGSNTWSPVSDISPFTTTGPPAAPTLVEPMNTGSASDINPIFRLWTTDINGDYLQYKIEICATSNCSSIIRTIDQTASQTGWVSQNAASGTAYTADVSQITRSQQAAHIYQDPQLTVNTTYWWRAYAIDPAGINIWSPASNISSFSTNPSLVRVTGGTRITGGTKIGP